MPNRRLESHESKASRRLMHDLDSYDAVPAGWLILVLPASVPAQCAACSSAAKGLRRLTWTDLAVYCDEASGGCDLFA